VPATETGARVVLQGARRWRLPLAPLRAAVVVALAEAAPRVRGEVTVVLTGDSDIRALNRDFRGKDRPTDVLSFDIGDGLAAGEPFGDIVISVETARRQAREYDAPVVTELQRLLVHGALHLCGYDHQEKREAARMRGLTRKLLERLSLSPRRRRD
jgi:probable rRNA maturation factor